jgi:hypothetical protein
MGTIKIRAIKSYDYPDGLATEETRDWLIPTKFEVPAKFIFPDNPDIIKQQSIGRVLREQSVGKSIWLIDKKQANEDTNKYNSTGMFKLPVLQPFGTTIGMHTPKIQGNLRWTNHCENRYS